MHVYVKVLEGKTIRFDVEAHNTINNVKALVRYKEGIPTGQQRLIFQSEPLEDDHASLLDHGIVEGHTGNIF